MFVAPPFPTAAPDAAEVALRLAGRQNGIQTCGWIDADYSNPATCGVGSTCAVNTAYDVHYCCPQFPCAPPTACIDSGAAATACDSDCRSNILILKCTFAGYPACFTRFWSQEPFLSGFGCAPTPFTQTVWTTNLAGLGQTSFVSTFSLTIAQGVATTAAAVGGSTPAATTNSVTSPTSTTSTPSQNDSSSSLSPGVIAGIAIGSIVGVVGLMVLWLLLRKLILDDSKVIQRKKKSVDHQNEHGFTHENPSFEMDNRPPSEDPTTSGTIPSAAHPSPVPQAAWPGQLSPRSPSTIFSATSSGVRGTIPSVAGRAEPVTLP